MSAFYLDYKEYILLPLVALLFLSLCPVEHLLPLSEAHAHAALADVDCPDELCTPLLKSNNAGPQLSLGGDVSLLRSVHASHYQQPSFYPVEKRVSSSDFAQPTRLYKDHSVYRI